VVYFLQVFLLQFYVQFSRHWRPGYCSRYSDQLWAGRSWDRIPVGARFSAPLQTGPGAHPAFNTMGTGSFPGIKWPGHGIDHQIQSNATVKERVELYLYSPSGPSWSVRGWTIPLLLMSHLLRLILFELIKSGSDNIWRKVQILNSNVKKKLI